MKFSLAFSVLLLAWTDMVFSPMARSVARPEKHLKINPEKCSSLDLRKGKFSGTTRGGPSITFMGPVHDNAASYFIYSYVFNNPISRHGTHRLLVFDSLCKYLGAYTLDDDPVRMDGHTLVFENTEYPEDHIDFEGREPPQSVLVNGTYSRLEQ